MQAGSFYVLCFYVDQCSGHWFLKEATLREIDDPIQKKIQPKQQITQAEVNQIRVIQTSYGIYLGFYSNIDTHELGTGAKGIHLQLKNYEPTNLFGHPELN